MEYENAVLLQGECVAIRKGDDAALPEFDLRLTESWYKGNVKKERVHVVTVIVSEKILDVARREVRQGRILHVTGKMRQERWKDSSGANRSRLYVEPDSIAARPNGGTINECRFKGVLGRDPELRSTPAGQLVTDFALALSEMETDDEGVKRERTDWVEFVAWGPVAEKICQSALKGDAMLVRARLQQDTWEDKTTGEQRSKLKFQADSARVISSGGRERIDRGPEAHTDAEAEAAGVGSGAPQGDDIPPF